jgi:uncharacterized protein YggE
MKSMAILLVAAAALVAGGCGGSGTRGNADDDSSKATAERADLASYSQQPSPGAPVASAAGITVVGTGSAKAVPDVAEWSFGVRSEAESASAAMSQNAAATRRLIDALKRAGIDGDDLRTESVTLYPQTDEMGRNVVGYSASNTVHATMKIAKAGKVIDDAVSAGANEVYGPNLRVSDSDAQYAQAVDEAFDDARARAEAVAGKAGLTLGRPVAIVEGSTGGVPVAYGAEAARLDAAVPIEGGSQEIQAVLTVTFAIS